MQLKTLIEKLQKRRNKMIKKHGQEPKICGVQDNWDEKNFVIEIYGKKKRDGYATVFSNSEEIKVRY